FVNISHDSLEPFGGSFLPIAAASLANSLASFWILAQSGSSSFRSFSKLAVILLGPLFSLPMIALTSGTLSSWALAGDQTNETRINKASHANTTAKRFISQFLL